VHADIGDGPPWPEDIFAGYKGSRHAHRVDRGIDTPSSSHFHHDFSRLAARRADCRRGAKALRHLSTVVVEINYYDLGWRVELSRQQSGKADRTGADILQATQAGNQLVGVQTRQPTDLTALLAA
jgi:conjugal transfer/entry exclusion protein